MLPLLYGDANGIDLAARERWKPYLITYLREAYDRGYPLIRPLPMQFSRDENSTRNPDVFMLGDEVLLAPVVARARAARSNCRAESGPICAPTSNTTEIRPSKWTRRRDRCRRSCATAGLCRSRRRTAMELHYFPSLGGEFFLWESEQAGEFAISRGAGGRFYARRDRIARSRGLMNG